MRKLFFSASALLLLSASAATAQSTSVPAPLRFEHLKGKTFQAASVGTEGATIQFDAQQQLLQLSGLDNEKKVYRIFEDKVIFDKSGQFMSFSNSRDTLYFQPSGIRYIKKN